MSSMTASGPVPRAFKHALNQPVLPPPPGVMPNFTNPPDHGKLQIVVTSLLLGVTVLFLLNRVYMKVFIVKKYTWDDCKFHD